MSDEIDVSEIVAELDELGRAKFDAAFDRVRLRKALARIDELERQQGKEAAS